MLRIQWIRIHGSKMLRIQCIRFLSTEFNFKQWRKSKYGIFFKSQFFPCLHKYSTFNRKLIKYFIGFISRVKRQLRKPQNIICYHLMTFSERVRLNIIFI